MKNKTNKTDSIKIKHLSFRLHIIKILDIVIFLYLIFSVNTIKSNQKLIMNDFRTNLKINNELLLSNLVSKAQMQVTTEEIVKRLQTLEFEVDILLTNSITNVPLKRKIY